MRCLQRRRWIKEGVKHVFTRSLIIIPIILASAFSGCAVAPVAPGSAQATVDNLVSLQEPRKWLLWDVHNRKCANRWEKWGGKQELTGYLRKDFDVGGILAVLPKLSLEPGYKLDFVYLMDNRTLCGWPVLYARSENAAPFEWYASLSNSMPEAEAKGLTANMWSKGHGYYLEKIRMDGSKEGFFQLVVLCVMGDQFYKYQSDWYHDELIICDKSGLDALFKKNDVKLRGEMRIPDNIRKSAYALSLAPEVIIRDNCALVSVVIFSEWRGFQRRTYTVRRYPPHSVLDVKNDVLVSYHCGMLL